jgi:eukaryotic-like serine/threonine-protein kinase
MPAPATTSDFFDVCRKSGVVEESSLSSITDHAGSPVAAAKALIRAGVLTKFQAAQLLAGKYKGLRFDRLKILDRIGSGGMGTVFLCEHMGLRKQVAVKILPPDQADDAAVRERFQREARAAAALDHPNIVRVHDTNSSGGVHYIVMEYVDGPDLQTMLNKYGPLPYTRACGYIAQAALGLQHAHEKGLVHRDIKPANLLVDKDGVVKILDMGLARFNEDEKDNLTAKYDKGAVLGTADYMAPEQVTASSSVDIRADIYSLGATLYTLINGKPPFSGSCTQKLVGHQIHKATSLTEIRREVPKALSAVVERMMAKAPDDRYQTPAEVVEALHPWLEMDTIPLDAQQTRKMPGSRVGRRRPPARGKSKMPLVVVGVAAAAVLFGGLGVWALTGKDKGNNAVAAAGNPNPPAAPAGRPAGTPVATPTNPNTAAPAGARLTYEIDFSRGPHFFARFEDKELLGLDGEYPTGWMTQSWRAGAAAEVGIQDHSGVKAVVIRTTRGDGASAELHTAHGASPYQFVAGRQYLLRTEYANVGNHTGSFEVRFDDEHPPVKTAARLPPTGGEWRTAELRFTAPPHDRSTTYYTHWEAMAPEFLVVRSVQVFEYGTGGAARPTVSHPQVVWETDFAKAPLFRGMIVNPGGLKLEEGRLPDGWTTFVWKKGSAGDVGQEEFAGKTGIAFRTTAGDPSAEITTHTGRGPHDTLKAGRRYRVDLEYAAPGTAGGRLDVRLDDPARPSPIQIRLTPTGEAWRTVGLDVSVPADRDRPFSAYISNLGFGPENTMYVKSLTLSELVEGPAPAATPMSYRLNLTGAKAFARRYKRESVIESQGEGNLPAPWGAQTLSADTLGDVFIEPVGGQPAIGLRNDQGPPSVRLYTRSGLVQARAGRRYAVKVTYQTEASGKGGFRVAVAGSDAAHGDFEPSVGTWRDIELTLTAAAPGPLTMAVECASVGSEASLYIKGVEVREAD